MRARVSWASCVLLWAGCHLSHELPGQPPLVDDDAMVEVQVEDDAGPGLLPPGLELPGPPCVRDEECYLRPRWRDCEGPCEPTPADYRAHHVREPFPPYTPPMCPDTPACPQLPPGYMHPRAQCVEGRCAVADVDVPDAPIVVPCTERDCDSFE